MRRVATIAVAVADPAVANSIQDRLVGLVPGNNANELSTAIVGVDQLLWQANASIPTSTITLIDTGDWHDRTVEGFVIQNGTATDRIGQSTDYNFDATVAAAGFARFNGYLGKGGWSNTAGAGTPVSGGAPPVRGSGGVTSWRVDLLSPGGQLMLYTDPSTGKLYLHNNTVTTIQPTIYIRTLVTGLRP